MNPRMSQMSGAFQTALSAIEQGALVDLWELDLRPLVAIGIFTATKPTKSGKRWYGRVWHTSHTPLLPMGLKRPVKVRVTVLV